MTPMCSLLDDWENCTSTVTVPRPTPVVAPAVTVSPPLRKIDAVAPVGNDVGCESIREELDALRSRIDADRKFVMSLTGAVLIVLILQITAQIRLDNLYSRKL